MKYCPYCGAELQDDMAFCLKCGKKHPIETKKKPPIEPVKVYSSVENKTVPRDQEYVFEKEQPQSKASTKKTWIIALIALAILGIVGFVLLRNGSFSNNSKAIESKSKSVIMVSCYDKDGKLYSTGSAFALFEDGVFVTNCHVILGDVYSIRGSTEEGDKFDIQTVVAYNENRDIAILRTNATTGLSLLTAGKTNELEKGSKVTAIGSPLGLINTVSTGVYSGTVKDGGQNYLQFDAAISPGSSGGALFNDHGEVIGITSASYTEGQNLNLAIPIEDASKLWSSRPKTEKTIAQFYDLWDHIPTYDVNYVINHYDMLISSEFYIEGYLSSITTFQNSPLVKDGSAHMFIASSTSGVCSKTGDDAYNYDRVRAMEGEVVSVEYGYVTRIGSLPNLSPGQHIIILCTGIREPTIYNGEAITPYSATGIEVLVAG